MTAWFDPHRAVSGAVQLDLPLPAPVTAFVPRPAVRDARRMRGRRNYLSGLAAESAVEQRYALRGHVVLARRWRGSHAEIDLILRDGSAVVFVEVKKSRSFERALLSLGRAQRARIAGAAAEFLGRMSLDQMTEMRFDLALMNEAGDIEIIENAFAGDE